MRSKTLCALAVTAGTLAAVPAASAAPPANDAFETPAVLGDAKVAGSVAEATRQAGEPEHGWQSVWYVHRPSTSGRVAVRLSPEFGWGIVTVYTGSSLATLQEVGRASENGYGARVAFDAVAGQDYRIVVANRSCSECTTSPFDLEVRPAPLPANDDFSAARTLRIPGEYRGNVADATAELGEVERHRHSVWYRIKPRRTGSLTIDLDGRRCGGASMTLYTGRELSGLRRVRSGDPIRLEAQRGRVYRLAVDCTHPGLGDFALSLSDGSIKGKGVKLAVTPDQTVESVVAHGLRMTVSAKRRVGVGIELRVSRAVARRLGLDSRVLGRTSGAVDYGKSLPAVLRLTGAARRALADAEHLRAVLRLEILRTDAPNRVLRVLVRL